MTRSGVHIHSLVTVVLWSLILVHDLDTNGRAQCQAELSTRLDLDLVFLISRGCNRRLTRSSSCHLGLDVGFSEGHTGRATINDGTDAEAVRFAIAGRLSKECQ